MRLQLQHVLRFCLSEHDQELVFHEWKQFETDIEDGNLLNISDILEDYYNGKIGIEDIISTFPPTEKYHLSQGRHDRLIQIYNCLENEFSQYRESNNGNTYI